MAPGNTKLTVFKILTMKERPILFSTPMVQAILAGEKMQTRRMMKQQPPHDAHEFSLTKDFDWTRERGTVGKWGYFVEPEQGSYPCDSDQYFKCPYGQVGDQLWVRETFIVLDPGHVLTQGGKYIRRADMDTEAEDIRQDYIKAGYPYKWKPSIFMPREASRITLEITDIGVERLHDISEEDAKAEGVKRWVEEKLRSRPTHYRVYYREPGDDSSYSSCPIVSFETLWQKINGPESWEKNPWVWVVKFRRIEG